MVARLAVAKAIPLEKFATGMATSVTRATSPAMVAITVRTMVATVVLTAMLSTTVESFSITRLECEFLGDIEYGSGTQKHLARSLQITPKI